MKIDKRKLMILIAALCILTITSSVLCSFAPPTVGWTSYNMGTPTETDIENLIAITDFQYRYGSFNNYVPIACHYHGGTFRLYLAPNNASWSVSQNGNEFTVSSVTQTIMRCQFTVDGFGMYYTITNYTGTDLVFYRDGNGQLVKSSNFTYSTGPDDDVISDCAASWYEAFKVVDGYESALEEAESNGLFDGYNSGFADGLDQGYGDGFSNGFEDGYRDGEYNGYAEGVSEGYSEGYRDGYDDGYGAADPGDGEVVTEIVYRDPVEINIGEIISGISSMPQNLIGSSFGFELFGINIAGLLTTLIVLAVGGFIVGLFLKKR